MHGRDLSAGLSIISPAWDVATRRVLGSRSGFVVGVLDRQQEGRLRSVACGLVGPACGKKEALTFHKSVDG